MKLAHAVACSQLLSVVFIIPVSASIISITFDGALYKTHDGIAKNWVARGNFTDSTFIDGLVMVSM